MKKVLSVFLAILMAFSCLSVMALAEDTNQEQDAVVSDEPTTRNIMNEDGLVVPLNFTQLKQSFVFKVIEKIIKFILSLFGTTGDEIDQGVAGGIVDIGDVLDEAMSNIDDIIFNQEQENE